jgi:hypothetical protein
LTKVGSFYAQYFTAIWYILRSVDNLMAVWYIFPCVGRVKQEKSGNPAHFQVVGMYSLALAQDIEQLSN